MYHRFLILSSADGHLGCFHVLAIAKCCNEHWGTCVSFNSGFLSVYAQQWDFWVIWQFSEKAMAPHSVLLPGKSQGWRSLEGCSPWDHEESETTEQLNFHFSLSCIGKGNGKSQGRGSLVGCRLWGHTESDTTEAT